jgi:hypothetical protein
MTDLAKPTAEHSNGRFITFYSYKGGTGRSMAVANSAWILASQGARVLVIDWDLEAPGLHRYFHPFIEDKDLHDSRGLIEFLVDFVEAARIPHLNDNEESGQNWFKAHTNLLPFAYSLNCTFQLNGTLDFVPAGRQGPGYAARVMTFDWQMFYDKLGGGVFLEAVKQQLRREYDYILIDSRTGISDTSGICTVQLPDELVVCFTLNSQSIQGATAVAESASSQRRRPNGEVGLRIWPVPTRVETGEKEKLEAALGHAHSSFDRFLSHMSVSAKKTYWDRVKTLYQPWYAYEEVLAVYGDQSGVKESVLTAAEALTGYLSDGAITGAVSPSDDERKRVLEQFARDGANLDVAFDVFVSYHRSDAPRVSGELISPLEGAGLKVLVADRDFALGVPLSANVGRAVEISRHTLIVLTPRSIEDPQSTELETLLRGRSEAASRNRSVIPVMLESCKPPKWLAPLSYADFTDSRRRSQELSRLMLRLGATPLRPLGSELRDLLSSYLECVVRECGTLDFRGIGGTALLTSVPLDYVYVGLRGVLSSDDERRHSWTQLESELFGMAGALRERSSEFKDAQLVSEDKLFEAPLMPLRFEREQLVRKGAHGRENSTSLGEAFRTERRLVILGGAGSGKTTLLRWITCQLARTMLASPDGRVVAPIRQVDPAASQDDERIMDLGPARLPVLVRVAEFAHALRMARKNGNALPLIDFLGHTSLGAGLEGGADRLNLLIRTFLEQEQAVVLLDGIDEVTAPSDRDEVVHAIDSFISSWINVVGGMRHVGRNSVNRSAQFQGLPWETGGNQIIVTSRLAGYHASPITGPISHIVLQPMARQTVERFCDAWALAAHQQLFPSKEDHAVKDSQLESDRLKAAIYTQNSPQLSELASNPLMMTILALISLRKGQLPRQRSELYQTALEILVENWRSTDIDADEFIYVLSPLAAKIHSDYPTGLIREDKMREIITRELATYRGENAENPPPAFLREVKSFIRRIRETVGVLAEVRAGLYGFLHLTFQEYLAALYLVRDRISAGQAIADRLDDPHWREPILLALGHVSSNPDWGPAARAKVLRQILDADDPFADLLPRAPLLVMGALPEMENVPTELVAELLARLLRAYTMGTKNDESRALAPMIEKAVNDVYNSRHHKTVIKELLPVITAHRLQDIDQAMACATLIRANDWRDPELLGPLLRLQPYDKAEWSLPITDLLRDYVIEATRAADVPNMERSGDVRRQNREADPDGSLERSLRKEIAALKARLADLRET